MRVSLIVPVRNEAANIRQTLLGLADQEFPVDDFEIVVVDGVSQDGTADIVREIQRTIPNLRLLQNPKRLASAARNVGVRNSSGEFIVIVDGHCRVRDRRFVAKIVKAFDMSGADTLGRPQPLRAERPTKVQEAVAVARTSWLGHNPDSAIYSDVAGFVPADNVAVAYRRDVFDLMGHFDETFDACEDVEFNTRVRQVGLTCYFTPEIAVEYQPRSTLRGLAYQMMRYGRGRARLARKNPASITAPAVVPTLWLLWLVFALMVSPFVTPVAWALAASVAIYLTALSGESLRTAVANRASSWRLPLVFASIHVGYGWGFLHEAMTTWPVAGLRLFVLRPWVVRPRLQREPNRAS